MQPSQGLSAVGARRLLTLSEVARELRCSKAAYETAVQWSDILDIEVTPVLEDEEVGPMLAKYFD